MSINIITFTKYSFIYFFLFFALILNTSCSSTSSNTTTTSNGTGSNTPTSNVREGQLLNQSLTHDSLSRNYILYIPSTYESDNKTPLVLNFHGFGGSASSQLDTADMRALSERDGVILVYPQGYPDSSGYRSWNGYVGEGNKSSIDDFGFIESLIQDLSLNYNIDPLRIYSCGYSNGSFFSYALACFKSDLIASVGAVSGTMMQNSIELGTPNHPTSVISLHGTSDFVIPYDGSTGYASAIESNNYWASTNNITTDPTIITISNDQQTIEHYTYSEGTNGSSVEHYKIIGGNHVWFDITINGSDTNTLIWDFFMKHDKNGSRSN